MHDGLLKTMLATAPVGVVLVDPATLRVILVNDRYRQSLDPQWHDHDLTGVPLADFLPYFDTDAACALCTSVVQTRQSQQFPEVMYTGFARSTTYWDCTASPVEDAHGNCPAVMFTVVDITAQVRARHELEATNAALASIAVIGVTITTSLDFGEVMDHLLAAVNLLIPYEMAHIILDDGPETLRIAAARFREGRELPLIGQHLPKAGSVNGKVFRDARPVWVEDFLALDAGEYRPYRPLHGIALRSAICVPLISRGRVIGTFYLASETPHAFSETDLRRLVELAPQAASAVANALLYRETSERAAEAEALSEVAVAAASSLDLPEVLRNVLDEITAVVRYDQAMIALAEAGDTDLRIVIGKGERFGGIVGTTLPIGQSVSGLSYRENRSILISNIATAAEWQQQMYYGTIAPAPYDRSSITVPLVAQGEVLGVLVVVRDVADGYSEADLTRLERFAPALALAIANARLYARVREQVRELQRLNDDLQVISRHKSEFLANMSHELRTPLNAIIGFTDLLRDGMVSDPDEQQMCLEDIYVSARHLLNLVNDVLDITRIEAGQMKLRPEAFPLREEIAEVERVIAPLVAQNRHTLTVTHDPQLPLVFADRGRVRQVLLNLLSNANKFTPEGGRITVRTDRVGTMAQVQVTDTGIGIRPEDTDAVFEEFRQIEGSLARRYNGAGLGLALSKRFVELLGGSIGFESEPGVGTTFTLTLPLAPGG